MNLFSFFRKTDDRVDEAIKAFSKKGDDAISTKFLEARAGEGSEFVGGYGSTSLSSFNMFYKRYINKQLQNELARLKEYRRMAELPEIADVVEDAVIESSQLDEDDRLLNFVIVSEELVKNQNIVNNLNNEFDELFYNRINIYDKIEDLLRTYFIDGKVFYERIIQDGNRKNGIIDIKKLPTESMDFVYDTKTGKIMAFYQYLNPQAKKPNTIEEAKKDPSIVLFYPEQIGLVDYGVYGKSKLDVLGYLEKVRVPFNQLKLLETSVIIYRIIRAPERFVFKIDTGSMPREKALKYVEKIKSQFTKKQTFDPSTGRLTNEPEVMSILENFFIPTSSDGRGSDISTVGGNPSGFTNLDDIHYFAKKLYRALKYPISRVNAKFENQDSSVLFAGTSVGDISRDEVKWAKFLERQQTRFCNELRNLFLLHLEFKGLKSQYDLDKSKIKITMNPPSFYKEKQIQHFLETRFSNYSILANSPEFSKYFLLKKFMKWTDEDIQENADSMKKDFELGLRQLPEQVQQGTEQVPPEQSEPTQNTQSGEEEQNQEKPKGRLKAAIAKRRAEKENKQ